MATCHPDKRHSSLGLCATCYQRHYRRVNNTKVRARVALWRRKQGTPKRAGNNRGYKDPLTGKFGLHIPPMAACHPTRRTWANGMCKRCAINKWRKANPDKVAYSTLWSKRRKYGCTPEVYATAFNRQAGSCAICRATGVELVPDHCHATNVLRGLLCRSCNGGLGLMGDTLERAQNAVSYLAEFEGRERVEKAQKFGFAKEAA